VYAVLVLLLRMGWTSINAGRDKESWTIEKNQSTQKHNRFETRNFVTAAHGGRGELSNVAVTWVCSERANYSRLLGGRICPGRSTPGNDIDGPLGSLGIVGV